MKMSFPRTRDGHVVLLGLFALGLFLVLSVSRPDLFLSWNSFRSMGFQFPEFGLLALAITVTMLTGGIDLSVVSTAVLSVTVGALVFDRTGVPVEPALSGWLLVASAIAAATAVGFLCGLANGLLITVFRISPILATLGTMQLYVGISLVLTRGTSISGFPGPFLSIGNGSLGPLPVPLLLFATAALLIALLLNRTTLGFNIYLLGSNPVASRFAGIRNARVIMASYAVSGILASLSGVVMAARTNSVNADYGSSYLLLAILVAILGGINPAGGSGRILGVILAVISLQLLSSGLNMLRFSSFSKEIVWGALLLVVMAFGALISHRNRLEG